MRALVHKAVAIAIVVTATLPTLVQAREKTKHTVSVARAAKPEPAAQGWAQTFLDTNMHSGG